jgi:alpha-beta hydrolase superfamily lysophospholipase
MSDLDWKPDILGPGYSQHVIDLGADPDGEGTVEAVLVRREPQPGEGDPRGVVLYTHGFCDYFFQTALADFFAARGLAFYALDLRKCGRSRRPGHTAHYVSNLALYDAELDQALDIVSTAHPGLPVILAAHSTGGLIIALWRDRRHHTGKSTPVVAVVLNSPWLDLQGNWVQRGPVTQVLQVLARTRPLGILPLRPGVYGRTLHVTGTGEWDFDTDLKPLSGCPVTFGWLHAIRRGHAQVHRGLETGVPVLVLRSTRSHFSSVYSDLSDRADIVVDTTHIDRWAGSLGSQVTDAPIEDARHDVFLSVPESRERAYAAVGEWLAGLGFPADVGATR